MLAVAAGTLAMATAAGEPAVPRLKYVVIVSGGVGSHFAPLTLVPAVSSHRKMTPDPI
jgi:hypothetical protein